MAIISFENIAGDNDIVAIPDGYRHFLWNNFWAWDDEVNPNSGAYSVIHSGEASAFNKDEKQANFKSPDRNDDFDLNSGYFASFLTPDLQVRVVGYDDGKKVATKLLILDTDQEFVRFGPNFDDIDKVTFAASGGTDPNPSDDFPPIHIFGVDDLFLNL